jgi:hypothetical protein
VWFDLVKRNPEIEVRFKRIDVNQLTVTVYVNGSSASHCRICNGGRQAFGRGITYSIGDSGGVGAFNELLTVEADGCGFFLKPLGMMMHRRKQDEQLTDQGAAEYFWSIFIEPLQR